MWVCLLQEITQVTFTCVQKKYTCNFNFCNSWEIILFQKWNCSQEDNNTEHHFKSAKLDTFDLSPHMLGFQATVAPHTPTYFPLVSPENGHITAQQQMQNPPALQGQVAPAAEIKMTLFHWQIQQEAKRLEGVSPEQLNLQDTDGDT